MNSSFLEQFDKYKTSENVAVVCGNTSLTYARLYKLSLSLASKFNMLGIGIDSTSPENYDIYNPKATKNSPWVVIITDRSVSAVVGIIATMMAKGAYVLMEQNAPDAYIDSIIEDTAASVVLRCGDFINVEHRKLSDNNLHYIAFEIHTVVNISEINSITNYQTIPNENLSYIYPKENEIACAVFTSGSTGKPKGAVLEQHTINEMIRWQTKYMKPTGWTATASYAPLSFIAAIWEIFFPLSNGLTLHILDETIRHDLFALEDYIEKNNISYLFLPPNIAEIFTKTYQGNALKYLRIAGGRLKSCGDPKNKYEIMYHLGMSENGGSVTIKSIDKAMNGDISIGSAWNQTKVYLVDEKEVTDNNLHYITSKTPVAGKLSEERSAVNNQAISKGEIAVSGPSLFRGYLSRLEETNSKLVKNPYTSEPGYEMMYLSGDLAQINENNELIHMGRSDLNIKIRDMKVNPMQVESALLECFGISECCVTTQMLDGENALIGFVTGSIDEKILRKELSKRLPEFMIPSVFIQLEKLPRNINGKIDRSLLIYKKEYNEKPKSKTNQKQKSETESESDTENQIENQISTETSYTAGTDEYSNTHTNTYTIEEKIIEIFRCLLSKPKHVINLDDSLLHLGGDSLRFIQLQAEIMREFSKNIPYAVLFENPTPRLIASVLQSNLSKIDEADESIPPAKYRKEYPLSGPMRQMWFLWRTSKDVGKYTVSIKCSFTGDIDTKKVKAAFKELVNFNKILRSRFIEHDGEPFQIIEESVDISINNQSRSEFDLSVAPVFDISLNDNILKVTTHHIIADATALRIIMEDFWTLYCGEKPQGSVQAHDVTMWNLNKDIKADENYWSTLFSNKIPSLTLPYDFARPEELTSSKRITVSFDEAETAQLYGYAASYNVTIFQLFLAAYALLLSKFAADSQSVVIGVPFSGREHTDTARTIGMLVRTLPIKLDVFGMNLSDAVIHTRERFIEARNHQSVSLERLTEIIDNHHTISRNPFYDVMINYVPLPRPLQDNSGLNPEILSGEYPYALFDLVLDLREESDGVTAVFTYADELFCFDTIYHLADGLKNLLLTHELILNLGKKHTTNYQTIPNEKMIDETSPQICELLQVWADILNIKDVSLDDDFYIAGGTSLAAIRIEAALFEKGWILSASDIIRNPKLYEAAAKMIPLDEINWEDEEW